MAGGTFALVAERTVAVPAGRVRVALSGALRDAGFTIEFERTLSLAARRGNTITGAVVSEKLPLRATVQLSQDGPECRVALRVEDGWGAGTALGPVLEATYRSMLAEVGALLDEALTPLDRDAAARFEPARYTAGRAEDGKVLDWVVGTVGGAASRALGAADRRLSEPLRRPVQSWALVRAVTFTMPEAEGAQAVVGRDEVEEILAVAALVGAQPSDLPRPLVDHTAKLAARIEASLDAGRDVVAMVLSTEDKPVYTMLRQQAALRDVLPARRLLVCRDCRAEKVINEEYERIATRNRRVQGLLPWIMTDKKPVDVLRLVFRRGLPMPKFVCARCQGMTAAQLIITFCPSCGKQHRQGVLSGCACGFDFTAEGERRLAARPRFELAAAPAQPAISAAPAVLSAPPVDEATIVLQLAAEIAGPAGVGAPGVGASGVGASGVGASGVGASGVGASGVGAATEGAPGAGPPGAGPPGIGPVGVGAPGVGPAGVSAPGLGAPAAGGQPAGWYADPWRLALMRYWDGTGWTGFVHPARQPTPVRRWL
jgi:hypothetical protein